MVPSRCRPSKPREASRYLTGPPKRLLQTRGIDFLVTSSAAPNSCGIVSAISGYYTALLIRRGDSGIGLLARSYCHRALPVPVTLKWKRKRALLLPDTAGRILRYQVGYGDYCGTTGYMKSPPAPQFGHWLGGSGSGLVTLAQTLH